MKRNRLCPTTDANYKARTLHWPILIGMLFCFVFLSPLLSSQEQEITDPKQREVSVTLKLIQVYVSDKKGNPIRDLTKEDFILYDNGEAMTITEFEAHQTEPLTEPEKTAPAVSRINRKFFLLLDAYRNDGLGLKKARTTALHFIDTQVRSDDELGLLTYSIDRGLVLHKPLSLDYDSIRKAINKVKLFPSITALDGGATAVEEALDFVKYLNDFAVSLRYIPGYKHILLFSAGLPRSLLQSGDPRLRYEHERLAQELASSSSPIYSVDTQGTRDLVLGREQKGDDSLRRLADLTGGHHFPNVDYSETISQDIQNATGNYYVLGYYVGETWDGEFHEIKVKVERKGVKVQAQKGYFNPKAFSKMTKLEKRHHLLDLARNPSPHFGLPQKIPSLARMWRESSPATILLLTEIIPSDLEEIRTEKTEFFVLVYNEEGVLLAEGKKDLDLSKEPPASICIYTAYVQSPGTYECISILRNKKTGTAAKASSTVIIPEEQQSPVALSGPLIFVPERDSLVLAVETKDMEEKAKPIAFDLSTIVPQTDRSVSPLIFNLSNETSRLFIIFEPGEKATDHTNWDFSSRLISKSAEQSFPMKISQRSDLPTKREDSYVLELELTHVPAGEYILEITAVSKTPSETQVFLQSVFIQ